MGKERAEEIEKRIFLQTIDLSWKSHIQYLEQLRQVIGLRSYGQRDPLVEYKKGSKFLSVLVVVADKEVQDRKSKLTAFHQKLSRELAKSILNSVLTLNYELGVLNVKNIY